MALRLIHATPAQVAAELRRRYAAATGVQAAALAAWLLDRIDEGTLTDAQCRALFGMTLGQWTAAKARMTSARTNLAAVRGTVGE